MEPPAVCQAPEGRLIAVRRRWTPRSGRGCRGRSRCSSVRLPRPRPGDTRNSGGSTAGLPLRNRKGSARCAHPLPAARPRKRPARGAVVPHVSRDVEVVVIGAGRAGLSAAHPLAGVGFGPGTGFVVLDADAGPGGAWQHRWPSLTLARAHRIHPLPGMPLPDADPTAPASEVVAGWFAAYERRFELPVRRPVAVRAVRATDDGLVLDTSEGRWTARGLVNATGTWTRPFWPAYPGRELFRGRQLHAADYRSAEEFRGRHVVVVGGGTSAVQQLIDLSEAADTTWVPRRPPVWRSSAFDEDAGR